MNDEIFEARMAELYQAIRESRNVVWGYEDDFYDGRLRGLELAYRIMSDGEEA